MQSSLETNQRHRRLLAWIAGTVVVALLASVALRLVVPDAYLLPLFWITIVILVTLGVLVFSAIVLLVQLLILKEQ